MTFFANVSSGVILKLPVQNENGAVSLAGDVTDMSFVRGYRKQSLKIFADTIPNLPDSHPARPLRLQMFPLTRCRNFLNQERKTETKSDKGTGWVPSSAAATPTVRTGKNSAPRLILEFIDSSFRLDKNLSFPWPHKHLVLPFQFQRRIPPVRNLHVNRVLPNRSSVDFDQGTGGVDMSHLRAESYRRRCDDDRSPVSAGGQTPQPTWHPRRFQPASRWASSPR